jgi:hypothetical protein
VQSKAYVIDALAPVTSAVASPDALDDGWCRPAAVTLTATDADSNVAATEYRLGAGGWQTYTAPVSVTAEGPQTLTYRSTDMPGNVEAEKTLPLKIDATPPVTMVSVVPSPTSVFGSATATIDAVDSGAGVAAVEYRLDGGSWQTYGGPVSLPAATPHIVEYRSRDRVGNVEDVRALELPAAAIPPVEIPPLPGGPGADVPGPVVPRGGGGAAQPKATLTVGRATLRQMLKAGLPVTLKRFKRGRHTVTIKYGRRTIGAARIVVPGSGTSTVRVRISKRSRAVIAKLRSAKLTVISGSLTRTVKLRR